MKMGFKQVFAYCQQCQNCAPHCFEDCTTLWSHSRRIEPPPTVTVVNGEYVRVDAKIILDWTQSRSIKPLEKV